jgi:hypothetical protein
MATNGAARGFDVAGFRHHLKPSFEVEQLSQTATHDSVIVSDDDPN